MPKLTIVRGVAGSGKSTWAREQNAKVVSRDDIRIGLFNVEFDPAIENDVTVVEHAMIRAYLRAGNDVVSDNTNIEWKFVKAISQIGYEEGASVETKVFDVSLADCIKRNDHRAMLGGRMVPHEVIKKQYDRFQKTKGLVLEPPYIPEPYFGTPGKPKAFLVDVDGTLAHKSDQRGYFDWMMVGHDEPDEVISDIVRALKSSTYWLGSYFDEYIAIVMSGRDEVCRQETVDWLVSWDIPFDHMFMRPKGDMRRDDIVKAELFDTHVRDNYDVQFVLDDRDQVVRMWRKMGLTCLQVAEGAF